MKIQLISDTSCDLTLEEQSLYNVSTVPFYVSFDDKTYLKENVDITTESFYQTVIDNPSYHPKSSCPSSGDYFTVFEKYVKENVAIICICITTKFSGSYNSALVAKDMILEEYQDAKITVINSCVNTVLQGLLVVQISRMISKGLTYEEIIEKIEQITPTGRIFFTIGSLEYLSRGGRIGKLATIIADTIQAKPIIVLQDGEIFSKGLVIGRKRSILKVIDTIKQYFVKQKEDMNDYEFVVGYGSSIEEGLKLQEKFQNLLTELGVKIKIGIARIGSTIAVHTGPHPIGIAFIKRAE